MSRPGDPSYAAELITAFRDLDHHVVERRDRLVFWIYPEGMFSRRELARTTPAAVLLMSDEDISAPFLWVTSELVDGEVTKVSPADWRWPYVAEQGTPIPVLAAEVIDTLHSRPSVEDQAEAHAALQDHPNYQGAPA